MTKTRKKATRAKAKKAAATKVSPIAKGFHSVTPHLTLKNAAQAIDWYRKAFGAKELLRMPGPGGSVMHAEIKIGDSVVMFSDESPQSAEKAPESAGASTASLMIYTPDVDKTFQRAVTQGAKTVMPPTDMFWGDRFGTLHDPFGHAWSIATHTKDLSPKEMQKAQQEFFARMQKPAN